MTIFQPGGTFDAATDIDRVGRNRADRIANVLRIQAAGKKKKSRKLPRGFRNRPITGRPRATA